MYNMNPLDRRQICTPMDAPRLRSQIEDNTFIGNIGKTASTSAHCSNTKLLQTHTLVEASWNVMAHAQKPEFAFQRNGLVHLNRRRASVQSITGSWGVRISGSNVGYTILRDSVKGTGYSLHSPVSSSLSILCVTVCHYISTGVYLYICVLQLI